MVKHDGYYEMIIRGRLERYQVMLIYPGMFGAVSCYAGTSGDDSSISDNEIDSVLDGQEARYPKEYHILER